MLEQVKAKLDVVIQQQSEMLINQRIALANQEAILANQQETLHEIRTAAAQMKNRLDAIHATQTERLQYEEIIESNTRATAFFSAANYFNNL